MHLTFDDLHAWPGAGDPRRARHHFDELAPYCPEPALLDLMKRWGYRPSPSRRPVITGAMREIVADRYVRAGERVWITCAYCPAPLLIDRTGPARFLVDGLRVAHLDHEEPLARGGPHTPENLFPACRPCNLSKGARTVDEWARTAA